MTNDSDGLGHRFGYRDTGQVSGRPVTELGYLVVLLLAAGADLAAFHQVVSLVMPEEDDWLVYLLVGGVTACALVLAHFSGRLARDWLAWTGSVSWRHVAWFAIPWAVLGVFAFLIRLIVADSQSGFAVDGSTFGGGSSGWNQLSAALLFLALYGASGIVTAGGEFLTRNPLRVAYRRALRAHRRAVRRLARTQPSFERAWHVYRLHVNNRRRDDAMWRAAVAQRLAYADELKRYSAVLMAAHLQDPSATDGMTLPDRVPFPAPASGYPDGIHPLPGWASFNGSKVV